MKSININQVQITCPKELDTAELLLIVDEQKRLGKHKLKQLDISFGSDKETLLLKPHYDTIVRIRRITGYLSRTVNFNDAKCAEEQNRLKHI